VDNRILLHLFNSEAISCFVMTTRSLDNISFLPQRLQRNILNFLPHQKVPIDLLGINENETQLFYE